MISFLSARSLFAQAVTCVAWYMALDGAGKSNAVPEGVLAGKVAGTEGEVPDGKVPAGPEGR